MATATTLSQAAGQAFDNLHVRWVANQLGGPAGRISLFCQACLPIFPAEDAGSTPISNWLTLFYAQGSQLPAVGVPIDQLTASAEILYRLCWLASALTGSGITSAQATQLLAQVNTIIGF